MKRLMSLAMVAVVVGLACSSVQASIYNWGNDWSATTGPGPGWSAQWAYWHQNNPADFQNLVWNTTQYGGTGVMLKADQPNHYAYKEVFEAQPNLKVVVGWQAPSAGTVNFIGQGSNWQVQAVYQIIDKNGTELTSSYVNNNSSGSVSVENVSVAAGDRLYFAYRPNSGSTAAHFEGWPIKIEANFTPVPEPMTMGLLAMGGLLELRRRK